MLYPDKTLQDKIHGAKFLGYERLHPSTIQLKTDRGLIHVNVCGDCCSHSIFYDVVVPEECYGAEIISFGRHHNDDSKMPDEQLVNEKAERLLGKDNWYAECLSIWDVKFNTVNGTIYLRHVNSSNGYYDGMLSIQCKY